MKIIIKKKIIIKIKIFKSYNEISNMKSAKFINEIKSSIFDTGASRSGTSDSKLLKNLEKCEKVSVQGAFGPPYIPSLKGKLGPLELETLVIPGMNETLLSVYQICNGGSKDFQCIALFTTEGCRIFRLDSVRRAIKDMHDNGIEIMRGLVHQGLYHEDKSFVSTKSLKMLMASTRAVSKYDQVHLVLGHPGKKGMEWHRRNTINADYTQEDADVIRPVCEGCVYGGMRQTSTDHLREHRQNPIRPGQIFVMDAYTHKHKSFRGMFYADIFRDIATQMIYVVYTKNRSATELVDQLGRELDKHPEWSVNLETNQRRLFRVDADASYRSQEFTSFLASRFYKIEMTPSRDKHAGGIAERTVGLLSLKTNIAMISPIPNVPNKFWELGMTYAAVTLGFNFSEKIGTSPYYYIKGSKANVKYLHPFWSKCYVYIPLELRKGKIGVKRAHKARFVGYNNSTILFPNYLVMEMNDDGTYGKVKSSKDVIFDNSIEYNTHTENEEPYDREFNNPESYIPYAMRMNVPDKFKGPNAIIPKVDEVIEINKPTRTSSSRNRFTCQIRQFRNNSTGDGKKSGDFVGGNADIITKNYNSRPEYERPSMRINW